MFDRLVWLLKPFYVFVFVEKTDRDGAPHGMHLSIYITFAAVRHENESQTNRIEIVLTQRIRFILIGLRYHIPLQGFCFLAVGNSIGPKIKSKKQKPVFRAHSKSLSIILRNNRRHYCSTENKIHAPISAN